MHGSQWREARCAAFYLPIVAHNARQAPFCVHPKTGKVCVPLDVAEVWDFDPDEVGGLS